VERAGFCRPSLYRPFTLDLLPVPILGYVDDFVLLATSVSDQCVLPAVAERCNVLIMVVNCAQTRLMVFAGLHQHARESLSPLPDTFRGQPLEVVQQTPSLGVMLSSSMPLVLNIISFSVPCICPCACPFLPIVCPITPFV
jgi:hypothetical protein